MLPSGRIVNLRERFCPLENRNLRHAGGQNALNVDADQVASARTAGEPASAGPARHNRWAPERRDTLRKRGIIPIADRNRVCRRKADAARRVASTLRPTTERQSEPVRTNRIHSNRLPERKGGPSQAAETVVPASGRHPSFPLSALLSAKLNRLTPARILHWPPAGSRRNLFASSRFDRFDVEFGNQLGGSLRCHHLRARIETGRRLRRIDARLGAGR